MHLHTQMYPGMMTAGHAAIAQLPHHHHPQQHYVTSGGGGGATVFGHPGGGSMATLVPAAVAAAGAAGPPAHCSTLFVANIGPFCSELELKDLFSR